MGTANEDLFDDFLVHRGHETERPSWDRDHNKKQCPDCGGLHDLSATECAVCGWSPQ